MIKIPYDELGKMSFQQTVQKLANSPLRDPVVFQIKHMTKALREGFFAMREDYQANVEGMYAEKEGGKIVEPKEGTKAFELKLPFATKDEVAGDAKGALDAFGKKLFTLDRKKLDFEIVLKVNEWSPRELESLEPIINEPGEA